MTIFSMKMKKPERMGFSLFCYFENVHSTDRIEFGIRTLYWNGWRQSWRLVTYLHVLM